MTPTEIAIRNLQAERRSYVQRLSCIVDQSGSEDLVQGYIRCIDNVNHAIVTLAKQQPPYGSIQEAG